MTTKNEVNLVGYKKKPPRLLKPLMETAFGPGGGLHPLLDAARNNDRLRFEIRNGQFNIYYRGGSLLKVGPGKVPWAMRFDEKYFKGGVLIPFGLPTNYSGLDDSRKWADAIPDLMKVMDDWWTRNPKNEREHCQAMAAANSATHGLPQTDYLVLDLEYHCDGHRFDLIAARRRISEQDPTGWAEPGFVFVEVKSDYRTCCGESGLGKHSRDYRDTVTAWGGQGVKDIKLEYQNLIAQKQRLGLLPKSFPFKSFSAAVAELLIVTVGLDPDDPRLRSPLTEVMEVSNAMGKTACIRFMHLDSSCYKMTAEKYFFPQNNSVHRER
jgi:hypothetical protein